MNPARSVCSGLHLPLQFDTQRLQADLALIRPEEWVDHYNERDYGGDWKGVALRSDSGQSSRLFAGVTESTDRKSVV